MCMHLFSGISESGIRNDHRLQKTASFLAKCNTVQWDVFMEMMNDNQKNSRKEAVQERHVINYIIAMYTLNTTTYLCTMSTPS